MWNPSLLIKFLLKFKSTNGGLLESRSAILSAPSNPMLLLEMSSLIRFWIDLWLMVFMKLPARESSLSEATTFFEKIFGKLYKQIEAKSSFFKFLN